MSGRQVAYLLSEKTGRFAASLDANLPAKKLSLPLLPPPLLLLKPSHTDVIRKRQRDASSV